MEYKEAQEVIEILANNAVNGGQGYFDDLIISANIPDRFKQNGVGRFVRPRHASGFVSWALDLGKNPNDSKENTIAALLKPLLDSLAFEKAARIAVSLISNRYLRQEDAARLGIKFGIPTYEKQEQGIGYGPDFSWRGPQDSVDLQSIWRPSTTSVDVGFVTMAVESAQSICRIESLQNQPKGTGFLIRPDIVVTCCHVFSREENVKEDGVRSSVTNAQLRFGVTSATLSGGMETTLTLHEDCVIAFSPVHQNDFILIRLSEQMPRAPRPARTSAYRKGEGVNILHHPLGTVMQLNISPSGVTWASDSRVQYICDTAVGSSGAPCFDDAWNVVALHHAVRSNVFGIAGEGIPILPILEALEEPS
jgi:hypothetical protein